MGNVTSAKRGDRQPFAIEYVARYVSITKDQFKDLRSRCYMDMDSRRKIDRYTFSSNVQLSNIKDCKDVEILDCLFTMWDVHGEDLVLCPPFILSLVPLVCPNESFEKIITFALEVFQSETKGILTADRLVFILKHLNQTASYFGDSPVTFRQIYKIVDDVFGSLSVISEEGSSMTDEQVIDALVHSALVRQILSGRKQVHFAPVQRVRRDDASGFSTDNSSLPLTPIARVRLDKIGEDDDESKGYCTSTNEDSSGSDYLSDESPPRNPWLFHRKIDRSIAA